MPPLNPFKRRRYLLYTTLTHADAGKSVLKGADRYNDQRRSRCIMVTTRGDHFTAAVEPFTIGERGTGRFMSYFVIEAEGRLRPTYDGAVVLTIGFRRSVSLAQILWRLIFYVLDLGVILSVLSGRLVVIFPIAIGMAFLTAATVLPWSCVAYVQGMFQAGRDWRDLLEVIRGALNSHTVEPA